MEHVETLLMPLLIFVGLFATFMLLFTTARKQTLRSRLKFLKQQGDTNKEKIDVGLEAANLGQLMLNFMQRYKNLDRMLIERYKLTFEQCGWNPTYAPLIVILSKAGLTFVLLLALFIADIEVPEVAELDWQLKIALVLVCGLVGVRGLDYITDYVKAFRYNLISRDLSSVINLLVIGTRAGMSLDRALERVAREFVLTNGPLARELTLTAAELAIIPNRRIALENFAKRVDLPLIKSLCISIIQAEQQGVSISYTMHVIAEEHTRERLLLIEEKASKIAPKLTLPVMLLTLPAIGIIVLGPAIHNISQSGLFK